MSVARQDHELKLDMTPMIDCVFQLLIFFIISLKPEDVLTQLTVNRPATPAGPVTNSVPFLQIGVYAEGFTLNDRAVSRGTLQALVEKLARASATQTVVIKCAPDSTQEQLVDVLDLCASNKLVNLSTVSL